MSMKCHLRHLCAPSSCAGPKRRVRTLKPKYCTVKITDKFVLNEQRGRSLSFCRRLGTSLRSMTRIVMCLMSRGSTCRVLEATTKHARYFRMLRLCPSRLRERRLILRHPSCVLNPDVTWTFFWMTDCYYVTHVDLPRKGGCIPLDFVFLEHCPCGAIYM